MTLFAAEIKVVGDDTFGLHFECSGKYAGKISGYLGTRGFQCSPSTALVEGTKNIHSFVSVDVQSGDFNSLLATVKDMLREQQVQFTEERTSLPGEVTVTLQLPDVSVYDRD